MGKFLNLFMPVSSFVKWNRESDVTKMTEWEPLGVSVFTEATLELDKAIDINYLRALESD